MPRMSSPSAATEQRVEAARYALLRRLAYAMRHQMVVHLQPIGMIMEVLERRLDSASPDFAQIQDSMAKVNTHARAAVQSSLDVVSWLAPEDGKLIAADAGVQETFELLRSHLNFRGFALGNEVASLPVEVSRSAVRSVLPTVLLALTDTEKSPAHVVIGALASSGEVRVTISLQPGDGTPGFSSEPHYRLLTWDDVAAIAQAEGVTCEREGGNVTLHIRA